MKEKEISITAATSPMMMAKRAPMPILGVYFFFPDDGDGDIDDGDDDDDGVVVGDAGDGDDDDDMELGVDETTMGLPLLDMFLADVELA